MGYERCTGLPLGTTHMRALSDCSSSVSTREWQELGWHTWCTEAAAKRQLCAELRRHTGGEGVCERMGVVRGRSPQLSTVGGVRCAFLCIIEKLTAHTTGVGVWHHDAEGTTPKWSSDGYERSTESLGGLQDYNQLSERHWVPAECCGPRGTVVQSAWWRRGDGTTRDRHVARDLSGCRNLRDIQERRVRAEAAHLSCELSHSAAAFLPPERTLTLLVDSRTAIAGADDVGSPSSSAGAGSPDAAARMLSCSLRIAPGRCYCSQGCCMDSP